MLTSHFRAIMRGYFMRSTSVVKYWIWAQTCLRRYGSKLDSVHMLHWKMAHQSMWGTQSNLSFKYNKYCKTRWRSSYHMLVLPVPTSISHVPLVTSVFFLHAKRVLILTLFLVLKSSKLMSLNRSLLWRNLNFRLHASNPSTQVIFLCQKSPIFPEVKHR